jgi:hypothetical protein
MKIAVAITNHNQHYQVRDTVDALYRQTAAPAAIYVLSDSKPYWNLPTDRHEVIPINNRGKFMGRCGNRNSVIKPFIDSDYDALIFMDGDCSPLNPDFIEKYAKHLAKYDLVFGTRRHSDIAGLTKPPSDLLTANMDNLYAQQPIDYSDLRVVAGAVSAWADSKTFEERLDLMLTGMIGWSCNFAFTKKGLKRLRKFQKSTYGLAEGIFDSNTFKDGWGYEDVAMGIDALYAGLEIGIVDDVKVYHQVHNRTDGLFDHVKGRHLIMNRYRELEKNTNAPNMVGIAAIIATAFFTAGLIAGLVTEAINFMSILGM